MDATRVYASYNFTTHFMNDQKTKLKDCKSFSRGSYQSYHLEGIKYPNYFSCLLIVIANFLSQLFWRGATIFVWFLILLRSGIEIFARYDTLS